MSSDVLGCAHTPNRRAFRARLLSLSVPVCCLLGLLDPSASPAAKSNNGTEYGRNRYDGYSFKVFAPDPRNPNSLSRTFIDANYPVCRLVAVDPSHMRLTIM